MKSHGKISNICQGPVNKITKNKIGKDTRYKFWKNKT